MAVNQVAISRQWIQVDEGKPGSALDIVRKQMLQRLQVKAHLRADCKSQRLFELLGLICVDLIQTEGLWRRFVEDIKAFVG